VPLNSCTHHAHSRTRALLAGADRGSMRF
jgi:hypothetical protein